MVAKCHLEFDGFDKFSVQTFRKIFESNAFPDVTLIGDDNVPIEAHKIILSAHSSVFENAFTVFLNAVYVPGGGVRAFFPNK